MNKEEVYLVVFAVVLTCLLFWVWTLSLRIERTKEDHEFLKDRLNHRAMQVQVDMLSKDLREQQKHFNALKEHLGICMVEQPEKVVVKKATGETQ